MKINLYAYPKNISVNTCIYVCIFARFNFNVLFCMVTKSQYAITQCFKGKTQVIFGNNNYFYSIFIFLKILKLLCNSKIVKNSIQDICTYIYTYITL